MKEKYQYKTTPKADEKAVIVGDKYRFTVLTSRLLRIEYSETGYFEDRATQTVINRCFDVPEFTCSDSNGIVIITTENVELIYTKEAFSQNSLSLKYVGKNSGVKAGLMSTHWYFGVNENTNLKGTARTLDGVDGECSLEDGIMSKGPVTVLDDSKALIICDDGWVEPRKEKVIDQYLFCYGDIEKKYDYKGCLQDYYRLTGKPPMIPRFALGNWWSRYYAYTQEEYLKLMDRFKKEDIPFSVGVIDMDWHHVKIDSAFGTGWTGYTWNKELFPDPESMIESLRDAGVTVSLNLHPQEGVGPHEKAYEEMAKAMGINPVSGKSVPFEIENPKFAENYFDILHHPLEKQGIRFWWIDWQQGNTTRIPGLDPLWMLNHFHYIDNDNENRRGLLFSRYAGPGSHRYPVGFSGDTLITWESLKFQPYFTANASNIGYGWWSHDIGGHMFGYRDQELAARWVQFGTFSPINRLHSTDSEFLGKEPWKFNKISEASMKKFLKLRHELIPYIYTMNYRASEFGEPLVQPLYYNYPYNEAFSVKNEYLFGSEMIVSPITSHSDSQTTMGSVKTYLPDGVWYDFFNNLRYEGGRYITMYRDLYEMPVLVKAGGIVPMTNLHHVNDIENPQDMRIKVFAGNNNMFELYEDDGETNRYKKGHYAITKMQLCWGENSTFTVFAPKGELSVIPENRNYEIEFIGIKDCKNIAVSEDGKTKHFSVSVGTSSIFVSVDNVQGELVISFKSPLELAENNVEDRLHTIIERFENIQNYYKDEMMAIIKSEKSTVNVLSRLMQVDVGKNILNAITEIITASEYR
ncbi:MAG: DUF5110 domain-containing protein [Clostridia bacterium]|nr:DUF5110 domain-containing protein [Clostridia bacterium]